MDDFIGTITTEAAHLVTWDELERTIGSLRAVVPEAKSSAEAANWIGRTYGVAVPPDVLTAESFTVEFRREPLPTWNDTPYWEVPQAAAYAAEWSWRSPGAAEAEAAIVHHRGEPVPEWAREQLAAETARLIGRALGS